MEHAKVVKYSMSLKDFRKRKGNDGNAELPITTLIDWMMETDTGRNFFYDFMEDYKRKKFSKEKIFLCEKCNQEKVVDTDMNIIPCQFGCESRMIAIEKANNGGG